MLKAYVGENRDDWDDLLPFVMMAYRATSQESTRLSPNKMMLGREVALPLDVVMGRPREDTPPCPTKYTEWLRQSLEGAHRFAREQLGKASVRQKRGYDKKVQIRQIRVGQFVWYWYPRRSKVKLGNGWTGPYLVIREIGPLNMEIQLRPGAKPKIVHIDTLKLCQHEDLPEPWVPATDDPPDYLGPCPRPLTLMTGMKAYLMRRTKLWSPWRPHGHTHIYFTRQQKSSRFPLMKFYKRKKRKGRERM